MSTSRSNGEVRLSQCQSEKKVQRNGKKIIELLNEHISKRLQSPGQSSWAAERLRPEFAGLGSDVFLSPACFYILSTTHL